MAKTLVVVEKVSRYAIYSIHATCNEETYRVDLLLAEIASIMSMGVFR